MKKAISMAMAAVMVAGMTPISALAAAPSGEVTATSYVFGSKNYATGFNGVVSSGAELQIDLDSTSYTANDLSAGLDYTFNLVLDGATFNGETAGDKVPTIGIRKGTTLIDEISAGTAWDTTGQNATYEGTMKNSLYDIKVVRVDDDELEITVTAKNASDNLTKDHVLYMALGASTQADGATVMDKTSKGSTASISVTSDDVVLSNEGTEMVYAAVEAKGLTASVRDTVEVAEEEVVTLDDIKIESTVGNFDVMFGNNSNNANTGELTLKIGSGFEFVVNNNTKLAGQALTGTGVTVDDDEITIDFSTFTGTVPTNTDEWTLEGLGIEATTANQGDTATLKVSATGCETVSMEVATVVSYDVIMSVDEDEDIPVIYSGVNVDNAGINDDSDHESVTINIRETFPTAFQDNKDLYLTLPEGVYVTDVDTNGSSEFLSNVHFENAYKEGDYTQFVFEKRTMDENTTDEAYDVEFTLTLVADPNFSGDVVLTMEGDAVEKQEVTIAKFVKPYTIEAQQNDLQIDYRQTEIPTDIVIKEAEAGLWEKGMVFDFALENINFDSDATATVNEESGLTVKNIKTNNGSITFEVDHESDDEAATVTLSDLTLYMNRSLPAGGYDLYAASETLLGEDVLAANYDADDAIEEGTNGYLDQVLFAAENTSDIDDVDTVAEASKDLADYTAKEGFVNIITAGTEDSNSFTTKLTVPIGGNTITAGEKEIEIDAPAYISNGYTMMPLRAVATALGIANESVIWNGEARTVTIMYGSKIIVMTVGEKTMYLNGSPVPMSAAPEITNDRTFLPLRDLGTALGVTDLTWETDPATGLVSVVYMNAKQ